MAEATEDHPIDPLATPHVAIVFRLRGRGHMKLVRMDHNTRLSPLPFGCVAEATGR